MLIGEVAFYPLGLALAWASLAEFPRRLARQPHAPGLAAAGRRLPGALGQRHRLVAFLRRSRHRHVPPGWTGWRCSSTSSRSPRIFAFPNRPLARNADARFVADLGLTIIAGFVLAFDFVLRAAAAEPGTEAYAIALVGAFIDWLMFVVLTVGAARKRDAEARATFAPASRREHGVSLRQLLLRPRLGGLSRPATPSTGSGSPPGSCAGRPSARHGISIGGGPTPRPKR